VAVALAAQNELAQSLADLLLHETDEVVTARTVQDVDALRFLLKVAIPIP
jgi:hypothetical protein